MEIKLDVIGVNEDNNLIVSRESLKKFEKEVDYWLAYYKMRVNRLENEVLLCKRWETDNFIKQFNEKRRIL